MKFFTIVIILALFPAILFAQTNYKPGYVVTLKGDTLKGYIDYREWDETPGDVKFKQAVSDNTAKTFTPADITGFGISDMESYRVYTGRISMDPVTPDKVRTEGKRDTSFRFATVFMKDLEKGPKLALYAYKDDVKERFFIGNAPGFEPKELVFRITGAITENTFQKQLSALALEHNELNDNLIVYIGRSEYKESDILQIVSKINGLSKADYEAKYGSKFKLNLFVGAGLNATATKPFGAYKAAGGISYNSYLPCISFGADFFANPKTRRLAFRMEFMASGNQYKSATIYTGSPYVPVRYSYTQLWGAIVPQVIYNFYNTKSLKIYGGGGLALTWYKYSNATYDLNYASTQVKNAPMNNSYFLYKAATPIMIKAGAGFSSHWGVFINYLTPAKVSRDFYFQVKTNPFLAGLNYYL